MSPAQLDAPRPPADFASLLATKEPVLLIGGQAVNLWALYYKDRTTDLAPFVSRDADVLGDRDTLSELGRVIGVKPRFFPRRQPGNEVGVVIALDTEGRPLLVEVLRFVRGATNKELREPAYSVLVGERPVLVRIPGPIALLKTKIANVSEINQTGRQDGRHVAILARVMPAYLGDLQVAAIAGRLDERRLLGFLEQLIAVVTNARARKVLADLKLEAPALFAALNGDKLPKLKSFLEKRLPRVFPG